MKIKISVIKIRHDKTRHSFIFHLEFIILRICTHY